jgi:hypothetical protein
MPTAMRLDDGTIDGLGAYTRGGSANTEHRSPGLPGGCSFEVPGRSEKLVDED